MGSADLAGGARPRLRRGGQGDPTARAPCVRRRRSAIPLAGQRRVAERQRRRRGAAVRGAAGSAVPETRRSISSTATTCSTPAATRASRELVDRLASFVALEGARGVVVFDGARRGAGARAAVGALRPARGRAARAARGGARDREQVCLVSSDAAVRGTSGQRGAEALARWTFLARPRARRPRGARAASRLADRLDEETRAAAGASAAGARRLAFGKIAKALVFFRRGLLTSAST